MRNVKQFVIIISLLTAAMNTSAQIGNFKEIKVKDKIVLGDKNITHISNDTAFAAADSLSLPTSWAVKGYVNNKLGSLTIATGNTYVVNSQAAMLALSANVGDVAVRSDSALSFILQNLPASTLSNWVQLLFPVSIPSVFGRTGNITAQSGDYTHSQVSGVDSLFALKQTQLNGTGFVKASGTTITYDNTDYLAKSDSSLYSSVTRLKDTATAIRNSIIPDSSYNLIIYLNTNGAATGALASKTAFANALKYRNDNVVVSGWRRIGRYLLINVSGLGELNSVAIGADGIFEHNTQIEEFIDMGTGIRFVRGSAFLGSTIKRVVLPTATLIDDGAFDSCTNLQYVIARQAAAWASGFIGATISNAYTNQGIEVLKAYNTSGYLVSDKSGWPSTSFVYGCNLFPTIKPDLVGNMMKSDSSLYTTVTRLKDTASALRVLIASNVGTNNPDSLNNHAGNEYLLKADSTIYATQTDLLSKENAFAKNTAFNKNFGTTSGTVAEGNHTHTFASITSKPTTIGGYGITDFNSLGDARWKSVSYVPSWSEITSKPTTVSGYGITDFNSLGDARWLKLTDTASMLTPYLRKADTTSMLTAYLRKGDTTSMLSPYLRKGDTASMLSPYQRTATAFKKTDLSATVPLTYNNTTGVFGITQANTSTNGYLSSTDWNTFNGKVGNLGDLGITATSAELNILDGATLSTTELNYVDGVTSAIQTQLNGKQATITGGATSITSSNLTASRALVSDGSGKVAVSSVTATQLGYVDGVTSSIQTQLNSKLSANQTITLSGDVTGSGATSITTTIGAGKVTNAMLAGSIDNSKLANNAISGIALGNNLNMLTVGSGLKFATGTSYNGGVAREISADFGITAGKVVDGKQFIDSIAAIRALAMSSNDTVHTRSPLHVLDSSGKQILYVDTASASKDGVLLASKYTEFNNKVSSQWTTNGSDINYSTGNVGIGVASPAYKLDADGDINVSATNGFRISGYKALYAMPTLNSYFIGNNAGNTTLTTGYSIGIGVNALNKLTSGGFNVAIGHTALANATTGGNNVAVGNKAMNATTTAGGNAAVGGEAMYSNIGGTYNTGIGYVSLQYNTNGTNNTAVGFGSLRNVVNGYYNTAIGSNAGKGLAYGNNNIFIGNEAGNNASQEDTVTNTIVIGYNQYSTASNQLNIGGIINGNLTTGNIDLTGRIKKRIGSEASSATPTINAKNYDIYKITALTVNISNMSTNFTLPDFEGDEIEIWITGTAARTISWGSSFVASTVSLPTTTSGTNTLHCVFIREGSTMTIKYVY